MKPYKAFWEIIKFTPRIYALNLVLQIFRSCFPLVPALVVSVIMDQFSTSPKTDRWLYLLLALLIGSVLARVASLLMSVTIDATANTYAYGLVQRNGLARLLDRPGALGLRLASGDLVNRLTTDTSAVADSLTACFIVFGSAAQALIAVSVLASVNLLITGVVILPLLLIGVFINLVTGQIRKYHSESRAADAEVSSFLREMFTAAQAIRLSGAQARVVEHFREVNDVRRRRSLRSRLFTQSFLSTVYTTASGLGTGIVLIMAAREFLTGGFSIGDLTLFVGYLGWMTEFTTLFSQNLALYKQAAVSLSRLADALTGPAGAAELVVHNPVLPGASVELAETAAANPLEVLEVNGLTYRYPGSERGISAIDLVIRRGDCVVVTGPVGSGKTTLLRTVLGLLPAQEGNVLWNGQILHDPAAFMIPSHSAYTPQLPHLMSATIRENIQAGLQASPERLGEATRTAVLDQDLAGFEQGLDTLVGPRGAKLSGGQVQRVAAARMLLRDADLLVFDNVSSAVDANTESLLWKRLLSDASKTFLVVSHSRAAFEHATRIIVLRDGTVSASGTLSQLLHTSPELRALWDHTQSVDLDEPSPR